MLTPHDEKVLSEFASAVRKDFPSTKIWAFGSRINGSAREESDFDICVVVEKATPEVRDKISDIAWEVSFRNDMIISPIVYSSDMFENGPLSVSPLVKTILSEGVAA